MHHPFLRRLGVALLSLAACAPADTPGSVAPEVVTQPVVYGDDDRLEYYEAREGLQTAAEAAVTFIDDRNLDDADPGAIRFVGSSLSDDGVCADEPFADQPTASGCSAFLIDDRLIGTAGHCIGGNRCPSGLFAFGYYYESPGTLRAITEDDLYECLRVVAFELGREGDFAVMELDRAVTSAAPLEVDTSGVSIGDGLTLIGYPSAIPATGTPSVERYGVRIAGSGSVLQASRKRSINRIVSVSIPNGGKGLISTQRTSTYSIPLRASATTGASPLCVTRLGRIGL